MFLNLSTFWYVISFVYNCAVEKHFCLGLGKWDRSAQWDCGLNQNESVPLRYARAEVRSQWQSFVRKHWTGKVQVCGTGRCQVPSVCSFIKVSDCVSEVSSVFNHICCRRFENDRTISFIPPDGEFELMSYRLNTHVSFSVQWNFLIGTNKVASFEMLVLECFVRCLKFCRS